MEKKGKKKEERGWEGRRGWRGEGEMKGKKASKNALHESGLTTRNNNNKQINGK